MRDASANIWFVNLWRFPLTVIGLRRWWILKCGSRGKSWLKLQEEIVEHIRISGRAYLRNKLLRNHKSRFLLMYLLCGILFSCDVLFLHWGQRGKEAWGIMFTSQHGLEVEYMRWFRIPKELRFCVFCKAMWINKVGDEKHSICEYSEFEVYRWFCVGTCAHVFNEILGNNKAFNVVSVVLTAENILEVFSFMGHINI